MDQEAFAEMLKRNSEECAETGHLFMLKPDEGRYVCFLCNEPCAKTLDALACEERERMEDEATKELYA